MDLNPQFDNPNFKIPGVLYTWDEISASFPSGPPDSILKWARFAAFPLVGVLLTLIIQVKSNRGVAQAFGESDDLPGPTPQTRT